MPPSTIKIQLYWFLETKLVGRTLSSPILIPENKDKGNDPLWLEFPIIIDQKSGREFLRIEPSSQAVKELSIVPIYSAYSLDFPESDFLTSGFFFRYNLPRYQLPRAVYIAELRRLSRKLNKRIEWEKERCSLSPPKSEQSTTNTSETAY